MKRLGYYAKDKNNNLFQFEWGADDGNQTNEDFFIIRNGEKRKSIATDYEILEIGFFTADTKVEEKFDRVLYNIILVHVARTWERIRVTQEHQEMPCDNICSADEVMPWIADNIYEGKIIQGFINGDEDDYWLNNTKEGMSDLFIEAEAERFINKNYLGIQTEEEKELEKIANAIPYKPYDEKEKINPADIIGVSPIEFVVDGANFDEIEDAFIYYEKLKFDSNFEDLEVEVFKRVWVSLSDEAIERDDRCEGAVECNVVKIDFHNNCYERGSIGYELWEWLKEVTANQNENKYAFEILFDDVISVGKFGIMNERYNVSMDTVINDLIDIDHMEIGGRGFIEYDDNVAKQNNETILRLMERYRSAKLV